MRLAAQLAAIGLVVVVLGSTACTITPVTCGGSAPDDCGGYCTNIVDDPDNCGGCGYVCGPGEACVNAQCLAGPPPQCFGDGTSCGTDADCCSGLCAGGYCGTSACLPEGAGCATDSDCCSPLYCDNGGCSVCVSSGNPCNVDADCCSGLCTPGGCN